MYDIIKSIIDHTWVSTSASGDQQYIMYICGAVILIFCVAFIDAIKTLLAAFLPRRKE